MKELFAKILPADCILTSEEALRPYECDGLTAYRAIPLAVLLPQTRQQVCAIVAVCHQHRIPIVSRGAGTGLSGGAFPVDHGIVLNLSKLNRILEVNADARYARVEPGVRNAAISEAAAPYGMYYAPDPSSQIACTIGGNIAENSGGVHCLKYGLTVHNVIEVEFIDSQGQILTAGGSAYDSPGYDLLAALHGSEGMLGIILEATVRLLPKPEHSEVLLAAFDDVSSAGQAVAAIIASGVIPAGLEMMDRKVIEAVEHFCHLGYPCDAEAILICELDGYAQSLRWEVDSVKQCFMAHHATLVEQAPDNKTRELMWRGRKAAFPALGQITPDYYCMDGTIPRKHLSAVLEHIQHLSTQYGLPVANVFHAGDGNLHPMILYDANRDGDLEKAEQLGGAILEHCVQVGGTITGEHGVGIEKLDQMCVQFNAQELQQFERLKAAFDPTGLLNPGKAIPTLHRCAEFGAMHVHQGKLTHPHLSRF